MTRALQIFLVVFSLSAQAIEFPFEFTSREKDLRDLEENFERAVQQRHLRHPHHQPNRPSQPVENDNSSNDPDQNPPVEQEPPIVQEPEIEKYNRKKHFGYWKTSLNPQKRCQRTRDIVLIRDAAAGSVSYKSYKKCRTTTGNWFGRYSGKFHYKSRELDIDHLVPLKHAYYAGAHKWGKRQRCWYTNYLGNEFHLMAVNSKENRRKGDRGPAKYMPPNENYKCEFLRKWAETKLIWELEFKKEEVKAIIGLNNKHQCGHKNLTYSKKAIYKQREKTKDIPLVCFRRN